MDTVDVIEAVRRAGGSSSARLVTQTSRAAVDAALRDGSVVADGRSRYVLPQLDRAQSLAHTSRGVLCLTSAALHHGWEVKTVPDHPHVLYPRQRRLDPGLLRGIGASVRGPGSPQVRRVCVAADSGAANPFESVLRDRPRGGRLVRLARTALPSAATPTATTDWWPRATSCCVSPGSR